MIPPNIHGTDGCQVAAQNLRGDAGGDFRVSVRESTAESFAPAHARIRRKPFTDLP